MEQPDIIIELLERIGLPILTLLGGWFGHMFRTKQKKEGDILENMKQILTMQSDYITSQDDRNKKNVDMIARLERKLDDKRDSIRQANRCKTVPADGCPVLNHEDYLDEKCKNCEMNRHDKSED